MGKVGDSLKAGLTGGLVGMSRTPGAMDVLGSLSPLAGVISGRGAFGALTRKKKKPGETVAASEEEVEETAMRKGGKVKKYAKGGSVSKRADGCAKQGRTKGRMV